MLVRTDKYSTTTARHITMVSRAVPSGITMFDDRAKREMVADFAKREIAKTQIESWLNGIGWGYNFPSPTLLRVKGNEVETSRGASFPLAHAKRGLALVRAVMERKEEWKRNGHTCHLGHYSLDRITPDGTVYAGCHVVPWTSIERIAQQIEEYKEVEAQ